MSKVVAQLRLKCPSCGNTVRVEAGGRRKRVQCPKCLNAISVTPPTEKAAPVARAPDRFDVAALESDLEILKTENAMLRARVEGLQAEKNAREAEPGEDELKDRLKKAESALREAAQVIAFLADMEKRVQTMNPEYIRAMLRAAELEKT